MRLIQQHIALTLTLFSQDLFLSDDRMRELGHLYIGHRFYPVLYNCPNYVEYTPTDFDIVDYDVKTRNNAYFCNIDIAAISINSRLDIYR